MSRFALVMLALTLVGVRASSAQDSGAVRMRLVLEEGAHVGRPPPPIMLPYATADSAGPASQPFDLGKELGRIVVLIFYPGDGKVSSDEWRDLIPHAQSWLDAGLVVAGVAPDPVETHVQFARRLHVPFKLVSDRSSLVARRYGATSGKSARTTVVLVGRDGRVRYVDPRFGPRVAASYGRLDAAIMTAGDGR